MTSYESMRAILLDIEGTTTPIDFVYEVLFPYARKHAKGYLERHQKSADVRTVIKALEEEQRADSLSGAAGVPEASTSNEIAGKRNDPQLASVINYVDWLMDQDRKSTALKSLQGQIWKGGYLSGELQSRLYPDVVPAFRRWRSQEKLIHIFSSGSVLAQKLLFTHTTDGDLTQYIRDYFDTTSGPKIDAASYRSISEKMGAPENEVLFVSDVSAELDAAQAAGMKTALCVRSVSSSPGVADGSARLEGADPSSHPVINTFDVLFP